MVSLVGYYSHLGQEQQLVKEDEDRVPGLVDDGRDEHALGGHAVLNNAAYGSFWVGIVRTDPERPTASPLLSEFDLCPD